MAQSVKRNIHCKSRGKRMLRACLALAALLPLAPAHALPDPTRPPNQFEQAGELSGSTGPVLQSVLISPQRRVAIISGQTVRVGDQFGGATLIRIAESSVVLRNGSELQTLKLFPDIEKRVAPRQVRIDAHPSKTKR